jgi:O-antigen ligase
MAPSLAARIPGVGPVRRWLGEHDQQLLRIAVILAVFAGSYVLGRRPSIQPLLGLGGIVAVLVFYRWPVLGALLMIIGGMAIPYRGPSGLNVTMLGVALMLGLWLMQMIVLQRRFELVDWPTVRAGLALCLVGTFALLMGLLPWFPTQQAPLGAQLGGLALIVLSVGAFAWASNVIKSLFWLKVLTFGFIAYASLHLFGYFLPMLGPYTSRLFAGGSTGSMFWTWLVVLAFGQAVFNRQLGIVPRVGLGLVALAAMYVVFVVQNDWKSGWVPPSIGIAVILALSSWRLALLMAVAGLIPAAGLVQRMIRSDTYSYATRIEAWEILAEIIKVNPVLGLGPANYYWYTPLFPIRGYFVSFNSHSQYVDLVAQFGFVGALAFLWFIFEIGRVAWRLWRSPIADGFAHAYVYSAIGGLIATVAAGFLGDWLFPFFYNVGLAGFRASVLPWIFLGGMVAIAAMSLPNRISSGILEQASSSRAKAVQTYDNTH